MKEDKDNNKEKDALSQPSEPIEPNRPTEPTEPKKPTKPTKEQPLTLSEVIKEQATEDEAPQSRKFSLRKILGGDILNTSIIRRQVWLLLLITFFLVIYIANRYSCQKDIIEIDQLEQKLIDAKYKALSSNSQLTEKCRESNVLEILKNNKDSTLKMPSQPPYLITVPDNN